MELKLLTSLHERQIVLSLWLVFLLRRCLHSFFCGSEWLLLKSLGHKSKAPVRSGKVDNFSSIFQIGHVLAGELCVPLDIDLELLPCLTKQHKEAAARFGIDPISNDVINPLKYVTGFINKLIRQKQKLDKGLLADRLTNDVGRKWQELLSTLEEKNRKVLEAKIGSLHFTMFCPTSESERQMKLQVWRETMLKRLRAFIRSLGEFTRTFQFLLVHRNSQWFSRNSRQNALAQRTRCCYQLCWMFSVKINASLMFTKDKPPSMQTPTSKCALV